MDESLVIQPEYPGIVKAVCISPLCYDTPIKRQYFDTPGGWDQVASVWITDGDWRVDMAVVFEEGEFRFVDCYCLDEGRLDPEDTHRKLQELREAFLMSREFAPLREDIVIEFCRARQEKRQVT